MAHTAPSHPDLALPIVQLRNGQQKADHGLPGIGQCLENVHGSSDYHIVVAKHESAEERLPEEIEFQ